jgi:hypothetical protein
MSDREPLWSIERQQRVAVLALFHGRGQNPHQAMLYTAPQQTAAGRELPRKRLWSI